MNAKYVFPNLRRGLLYPDGTQFGLSERLRCASKVQLDGDHDRELFGFVEIPADAKPNWSREGVRDQRYAVERRQSKGVGFLLHTDYDSSVRWYDEAWRTQLEGRLAAIAGIVSDRVPFAIELHPGTLGPGGPRGEQRLARLASEFCKGVQLLKSRFPSAVLLLENRTDQLVCDGTSMVMFLSYVADGGCQVEPCLDVCQMHTASGHRFKDEVGALFDSKLVPRFFHIHGRGGNPKGHTVPTPQDGIPWEWFFGMLRGLSKDVVINPEVGSLTAVRETIRICERGLRGVPLWRRSV